MVEYQCTHCGITKTQAIESGCGEQEPRYVNVPYKDGVRKQRVNACPMEIKNPIRRFLWYTFGFKWAAGVR